MRKFTTRELTLAAFVGTRVYTATQLDRTPPVITCDNQVVEVSVNHTDLLITWLYKMTLNSAETQYYMASVIGILVFVVVAVLSLIVYNVIPSTKNEEDFR